MPSAFRNCSIRCTISQTQLHNLYAMLPVAVHIFQCFPLNVLLRSMKAFLVYLTSDHEWTIVHSHTFQSGCKHNNSCELAFLYILWYFIELYCFVFEFIILTVDLGVLCGC